MSILILDKLAKTFPASRGLWGGNGQNAGIQALRGIDLAVKRGEILGLAGESGSGKSTLGRLAVGLIKPTSGRILFQLAEDGSGPADLAGLNPQGLALFRRKVQIAFQDPFSALNPRMTAGAIVREPLDIHKVGPRHERRWKIRQLLDEVGLDEEHLKRYPHQFSGGQRQRLNLARALALDPDLLIADEPVSALDVSIQAQIINLLLDLKDQRDLTMILISHDLPLIRLAADRTAVMYAGKIMEICPRNLIDQGRHHPYVEALWAAAPTVAGRARKPALIGGEPPSPMNPPAGCPFHPRCPEALEICRHQEPPLKSDVEGLTISCHRR